MSARLTIVGWNELIDGLTKLPAALQLEAEAAVSKAAHATASSVKAAYEQRRSPTSTRTMKGGIKKARKHLADSVEIETSESGSGVAKATVKVTAPHAHFYEFGTQNRQWEGGKSTGAAEARPTLLPEALRRRRQMVNDLIAIVERTGLTVTRDA